MSDALAEDPIGIFVEQRTWVSDAPDEDDYLICEYTIWNRSGQTISGLRAGLFFDWDFPFAGPTVATRDDGGFNAQFGVGWMRDSQENRYRGLCVVSPLGTTSYRYFDNLTEIYDGLTEAEKWAAMTEGYNQTTPPATGDGSHLIASGPYTIQADSAVRVAFAIIGATSEQALITSAQAARSNYNSGTVSVTPLVMQFNATAGGPDPSPQGVTITNNTDATITLNVTEVPAFALLGPYAAEVEPGGAAQITLFVGAGDRGVGVYRDTLALTTSDPLLASVRIPVTLTVGGGGSDADVTPNPFNPKVDGSVLLSVPAEGTGIGSAVIYDVGSRVVRSWDTFAAGAYSVSWDGKTDDGHSVASGVYFCRIVVNGEGGGERVLKIAVKKK
jgi:hypothetical protein